MRNRVFQPCIGSYMSGRFREPMHYGFRASVRIAIPGVSDDRCPMGSDGKRYSLGRGGAIGLYSTESRSCVPETIFPVMACDLRCYQRPGEGSDGVGQPVEHVRVAPRHEPLVELIACPVDGA